jgi:hypothetical protein
MTEQTLCDPYCIPLIIYICLSIIGLIMTLTSQRENKYKRFITQLIINILVGGLIYWLCYNCQLTIAWIVLLVPIAIVLVLMIFTLVFLFFVYRKTADTFTNIIKVGKKSGKKLGKKKLGKK